MIHAYDGTVTRLGQLTRPQSTLRSCELLVCTLLLGLLGMHGLEPAPGAAAAQSEHERMAAVAHMDVAMNSHSGASATASAEAVAHNAADVVFAKEMIQHHRQAVDMA
jgi:uncharacterized protein (DUF305 family)